VYVPLALSASEFRQQSSSHAALLHSIYALSAYNRAQLNPSSTGYSAVGTKHHHASIRYLQRGLSEQGDAQREAILATIIIMSSMEVINGQFSNWRLHLQGGRGWLRSLNNTAWKTSRSASILYQTFLCLEALGSSRGTIGIHSKTPELGLDEDYYLNSVFGLTGTTLNTDYCLDSIYGITRPVLEAIVHINRLAGKNANPLSGELEGLELKILLNNPTSLRFPSPTIACEDMTRHHACAFYYACYIHFKRALRGIPSLELQDLLRKSLKHLEAIDEIELNLNVCGLLWPSFITACEAEGEELRTRCIRLFTKGRRRGIEGICSAEQVVREVWRRRDQAGGSAGIKWNDVMSDMGSDILLI